MSSDPHVRVKLAGIEYTVRGYDDPEYLEEVAKIVDSRMQLIQNMQSDIPPHKNAVLTALNIADELLQTQKQLNRYQEEAADISQKIASRSRQLADLCDEV